MRIATWSLTVAIVPAWAMAQHPVKPAVGRPAATRSSVTSEDIQQLQQKIKTLGPWEEQHRLVEQATESLWKQNRWDSESDQFSRRVAVEVSAIPPWKFQERMDKLTSMFDERYGLTPEQSAQFKARLVSTVMVVTWKHADAIMQYSREMVDTRLAGKPFTSEQVARWARMSRPLLADVKRQVALFGRQFATTLDPRQREIFRRDLASVDKRLRHIDRSMPAWERGEWKPADWGLEKDPLHAGVATSESAGPTTRPQAPPKPAAGGPKEPKPTPRRPAEPVAVAEDESAWARYVREFIARYRLDDAQQVTARSVLADLEGRAKEYRSAHADELAKLDQKIRQADDPASRSEVAEQRKELLQPIADFFEELKERLDRLPTDAQRQQAGE